MILKVSTNMAPESILKVSIRQIKAARALLGWSQEELARAADISIPTIKRLEAGEGPLGGRSETGDKIRKALKVAGVEFIDENGGGAGVRLRKPSGVRSKKK
jgi:transcriptional regulator with XRE-family HTH domain